MSAGTGRIPATSEPRLAGSYVAVPGGRLWTEQAGSGPAVLFAHAGIADRLMWDEQMAALAGRYHVIRYDQRGYGKSSPPDVSYSPVADLGAVLDHAGADRAVLVGCSIGGAIAIQFLLAHPGRMTGLVLAAASTSGLPFEPVPEYFAALRTGDLEQLQAVTIQALASARSSPDVEQRVRAIIAANVAGQLTMGRNWLDNEPAYPRLGGIAVPTLVVAGDRDHPDFVRVARLLAAKISGARLEILPGADHLLPMRTAAAFTGLLAGFLDSLPR
ncbi:MAG: alpha/beta fold hydrolase [Streptosporangiaceae bacterium]